MSPAFSNYTLHCRNESSRLIQWNECFNIAIPTKRQCQAKGLGVDRTTTNPSSPESASVNSIVAI